MRTVRVFVSSPGDAANERKRVMRVVERLNAVFAGTAILEPVLWEERFYSAHDGFQPQIARSSDCDIVIAILRGRLGTPLPPDFAMRLPPEERLPDEDAYPSGTAYEILSAIAARRRGAELPDIFVFRHPLAPLVALNVPDRAEIEAQWEKLKSFVERVFVSAEGHFKGAYQTFKSTDDFETQVEGALRQWLEEHVLKGRAFVWPIAIKGSPFRGLEPFGAKHAEVFFGRDGDRARALDRIKDATDAGFPFLLIVGPSGAGKSSFARAGVLPWLVKPGAVAGVGVWRTAAMRPSDHPDGAIASLARHLFDTATDIPEPETGRPIALPELAAGDSATPQALAGLFSVFARGKFDRPDDLEAAGHAAIAPIKKALKSVADAERKAFGGEKEQPARLLLVVDQLDELFAVGVDDAARMAFARLLERLARTGLVWIVATLRAELYEAFLKSPLARLVSSEASKRLELTFNLLPPSLAEMAEVVRGPTRAAGLEWETDPISKERLDERLLNDVDRPDLLPLVQFVLDRLYEHRTANDETATLTFDAYRALGTLDGAIDMAAEKALSALGPAERDALPRLLRALVTYGGGKGVAALHQTPRTIAAHDEASTRLVDALIEARILVSGQDQDKAPTIALAHQRVIEAWKRARTIVAESESLLRVRDEVEDARRRWDESGQRRDRLIPAGLPLSEAENAATALKDELPIKTRTFVEKSGSAARLRQRLTAAAAVIFLGLAGLAGWQWKQAESARAETQVQRDRAERTLALAIKTANGLVFDLGQKIRNMAGVPASLIDDILGRARKLQEQLMGGGADNKDLRRSKVAALVVTSETRLTLGDTKGAMEAARQAVAILEALAASDPGNAGWRRDLSVSYNKVGDVEKAQGDLAAALKSYRNGLAIREALSASDPSDVERRRTLSMSYKSVGEVQQRQGDLAAALKSYRDGLAISQALWVSNPSNTLLQRDLSLDFSNMGDVQKAQGDLEAALKSYRDSLTIREALSASDPGNALFRRDLSLIYYRVGDVQKAQGDLAAALKSYRDSLAVMEALSASDPGNAGWRSDLSLSYERLGDVQQAQGDLAAALKSHRDGLAIREALSASDPRNADWGKNLSFSYISVGDVQKAQGDLEAALKSYGDSLAILEALLASNPGNAGWQFDLALSNERIGDVLVAQGDLAGAMKAYVAKLDLTSRLSASSPGNAGWRRDLAVGYINVGNVQKAQGDLAAALKSYQDGLAAAEALSASNPGNALWRRDLSVSYNKVGDVQQAQGDLAAALKSYRDGLAVIEALSSVDPSNAAWRRDVIASYWKLSFAEPLKTREHLLKAQAILKELDGNGRLSPRDAALLGKIDKRLKALDNPAPAAPPDEGQK